MKRLALVVLVGCGAPAHPAPRSAAPRGDDITLYRDVAVIRQRIELDLPAATTMKTVKVAAGVRASQLVVVDKADLDVVLRAPTDGTTDDKPVEITLDVTARHAGHYTIVLAYLTDRLDWNVAYTMTANATRQRAQVRGALAIFNTTGLPIHAGSARVIDAELGTWRTKTSEALAAALISGTSSSTPPAQPRELGSLDLGEGETRVELVGATTLQMSSVLVYDPIGTKLDHAGPSPLTDPVLGITPPAPGRVTESFEITRDKAQSAGLPAGPVRLLDSRPDGSLAVLGEASLYDASTRVGDIDTIPVGTAEGVTGSRERRELTVEDSKRIVEEFVITIENKRDYPVRVLLREHLYRGQNWVIAYPQSDPDAKKEGPQQFSMRRNVPARSQTKILYVVVYTWGQ
ncbi:MAG: hypothetical protein HOV81_05050 [Kofleriaceae bacterium]|nr:hypothetical protein [Kofleriaceae bacterium]